MYKKIIRPILFWFDPETIHHFTFNVLALKSAIPGFNTLTRKLFSKEDSRLEKEILGLRFKNPVGLAAGFDKDARLIDELSGFGFGFVEIGTLTPRPQPGNTKPRLFRLPSDSALINRMGFNNEGAQKAALRLQKRKSAIIVGGNIGKNKDTPNEKAVDDYQYCFETLYPHVDYFVVNVSSPNTPGLRELQEKEPLRNLLLSVKALSASKAVQGKSKPVLLKIAPDLTKEQLDDVIEILRETKTDGVIATNTTISRADLITDETAVSTIGAGGLSGKPLTQKSTEIIKYLRQQLGEGYPIIGVGGIMSPDDAVDKLKAGADLIQLYTGFIYEGPSFVKKICMKLLETK